MQRGYYWVSDDMSSRAGANHHYLLLWSSCGLRFASRALTLWLLSSSCLCWSWTVALAMCCLPSSHSLPCLQSWCMCMVKATWCSQQCQLSWFLACCPWKELLPCLNLFLSLLAVLFLSYFACAGVFSLFEAALSSPGIRCSIWQWTQVKYIWLLPIACDVETGYFSSHQLDPFSHCTGVSCTGGIWYQEWQGMHFRMDWTLTMVWPWAQS